MQLAHAVAQDQTVSALRPVFSRSATRFHHPWRMLALLTYAYASGIWQSRSLADIAALDPHLAELCHGEPPSEDVIRRFRNQNSASIRRCLEHLLRLLWCERHNARLADLHPLLIAEILRNARGRLRRANQSDDGNYELHDAKEEEFLKEE
jgi:hypothetical protein